MSKLFFCPKYCYSVVWFGIPEFEKAQLEEKILLQDMGNGYHEGYSKSLQMSFKVVLMRQVKSILVPLGEVISDYNHKCDIRARHQF